MRTKRILSIALTLVMLLGMLPGMSLTASAAGNTTTITTGTDDAKTGTGTMTITLIIKADPEATDFDVTLPTSLTYDGTAKTASAAAKSTVTGMGTITVEYYRDGTKVDSAVNVGDYTVKLNVAAGTHYNTGTVESNDWKFTITKGTPTVTKPTANNLTFSGEAQALVTAGSASGGVMQYSLDNTNWSTEIPTAVNVGTYTVYYKVIGDANHNDTEAQSVSVEIKSKPNPAPTPEPEQKSIVIGTEISADAPSISDYLEGKTEEQLQSVTELKTENMSSLTDLSGIEKLTNLETLNIKNAENLTDISAVKELENLKTIDVSGCTALGNANLSGMKNLTEVSANGCESLSKLDVKGCDNLKKVDISGCKSLENADLSSLQNLTEVSAKGCESLSELDISNCESLTSLDCSESRIDTLKADGCVKLANLDCHENSLTQLDAAKNSLPNLNSLICYGQMRFNIELDASSAGYALDLQQYVSEKSLSTSKIFSAVKTSSLSKVLSVKAYNANGKELDAALDEITGVISFDSRPHLITYDYNTGFISSESADVLMDVSLYMTDEQEDTPVTNETSSHGSSSGCNVNNFALLALALALARRCRRK